MYEQLHLHHGEHINIGSLKKNTHILKFGISLNNWLT